ncbi:armadillo-type protein [Gaertneriomyces semiglobifer]|nr:armadillo-type protein [Gaertneriomyces semiglobifer]
MSALRRSQVNEELKETTDVALRKVNDVLSWSGPASASDEVQQLQSRALRCLQSWVQYGLPSSILEETFKKIARFMIQSELFNASTEVLIDLIEYPSSKAYEKSFSHAFFALITTNWFQERVTHILQESDEEATRVICRLLLEFGENFSTAVYMNLDTPEVQLYLNMLLTFTGLEGYFPVDQEICDMPLLFWAMLQESLQSSDIWAADAQVGLELYTDPVSGQPVFKDGAVKEADRAHVSLIHIAPATRIPANRADNIRNVAKSVYARLVQVLREKVARPPAEEWMQWPSDQKERFHVYRREAGDTLLACYAILEDDMLRYLVPLAMGQLNQLRHGQVSALDVEATLFVLKAISEHASTAPATLSEDLLMPLFSSEAFSCLGDIGDPGIITVRGIMCRLIGSYSEYLQVRSSVLLNSTSFVVQSFQMLPLAVAATEALTDLCMNCSKELLPVVDSMVDLWVTLGSRLKQRERSLLVKAVLRVVQQAPYEEMFPRLLSVLGSLVTGLNSTLASFAQFPVEVKESVIEQLACLKAACQGMTSRTEAASDDSLNSVDEFDLPMPAAGIEDPAQQNVARVMWETVQAVCRVFNNDEGVMVELCGFLKATLSSKPLIFAPNISVVIDLLTQLQATSPMECFLQFAGSVVEVYGDKLVAQAGPHARHELTRLILDMSVITLRLLTDEAHLKSHMNLAEALFIFYHKAMSGCPWAVASLPREVTDAVFGTLVLASLRNENDPYVARSALDMILMFVSMHFENSELSTVVCLTMTTFGEAVVREILVNIGGRAPRSALDKYAETLFKLVVKFPQELRQWLVTSLSEAGFPTAQVSDAEKKTFIAGVLGNRLAKRIKVTVHQFGAQCRGLVNTAY